MPYSVKGRIRGQKKKKCLLPPLRAIRRPELAFSTSVLCILLLKKKKKKFYDIPSIFFSFSRGNNKVSTLNPSCLCKDRTQQDPRLVIIFINIIIGQLFWPTPQLGAPSSNVSIYFFFVVVFLTRRKVDVCVLGMFQREKLRNPCKGRKRWWRAPRWEQALVEQHTHTKKSTHTFLAVQEIECSWQV